MAEDQGTTEEGRLEGGLPQWGGPIVYGSFNRQAYRINGGFEGLQG
jgi:hypothetical protein